MSDTTKATDSQAMYSAPTLRQRFWRAAGFRYHLGEEPPESDILPGWLRTDIGLHFGIMDRLRLLISGKLFIASMVHTDTPSPVVCKSRMDWHIKAPGDDFR